VAGVEERERQIPIEIQQQAVDLDLEEEVFGVAAPVVGCWGARGSGSSMSCAG
jgi:hypothetical protein